MLHCGKGSVCSAWAPVDLIFAAILSIRIFHLRPKRKFIAIIHPMLRETTLT